MSEGDRQLLLGFGGERHQTEVNVGPTLPSPRESAPSLFLSRCIRSSYSTPTANYG